MGAFDGISETFSAAFEEAGLNETVGYRRPELQDDVETGYTDDSSGPPIDVQARVSRHRRTVERGGQTFNITAKVGVFLADIALVPQRGDTITRTNGEALTVAIVETSRASYKLYCEAA